MKPAVRAVLPVGTTARPAAVACCSASTQGGSSVQLPHRPDGSNGPAGYVSRLFIPRRAAPRRGRRPRPPVHHPKGQRRRIPAAEVPRRLRVRREPEHQPRHHPHPRHRRVGPQRPAAVPDRGLRDREILSADRARHPRGREASGSTTRWQPGSPTSSSRPPTRSNSSEPSPATDGSTYCVLTNSAVWNSTAAAPNSSSRSSPNAKNELGGDRLQRVLLRLDQDLHRPAPVCGDSSTASPSTAPSSKPAPTPTDSPTPRIGHSKDTKLVGHLCSPAASVRSPTARTLDEIWVADVILKR